MRKKDLEKEISTLENKLWYLSMVKDFLYIKGITCLPDKTVYASIISNLVTFYKNSNDKTAKS